MRQQPGQNHQGIGSSPPRDDVQAHHLVRRPLLRRATSSVEGCPLMADLVYALTFIGVFLALALTLRGLERL